MKMRIPALLLSAILLTACSEKKALSNNYTDTLVKPSAQSDSAAAESQDTPQSAEASGKQDSFEAFGQQETDYTIPSEQIVSVGDTIKNVNLMNFSSGTADFVSQAAVTVDSVQRISAQDPLAAEIVADPYTKTEGFDWVLLTMTIENTGTADADFCCEGTLWSVPQDTMEAQMSADHFWTGSAYLADNDSPVPTNSTIPIPAGAVVTFTSSCQVSSDAPGDGDKLYWELNPHSDSFFYKAGRHEVYFVEIES